MKLDKLYVVTRPDSQSQFQDIVFETSPLTIGLHFKRGLNGANIIGLYTTFTEAETTALKLLKMVKEIA